MTLTRVEGCGCPPGGPCGQTCTCKARERASRRIIVRAALTRIALGAQPASGDAPPNCVCKVPQKAGCKCNVGGPCAADCNCPQDACLCKAPPEVLQPATAA
jgi:hypothetical protein